MDETNHHPTVTRKQPDDFKELRRVATQEAAQRALEEM
jgi:hypothetical protein